MSNLVESLKLERASLEAELRVDPRSLKIQKINELLAIYEGDPKTTFWASSKLVANSALITGLGFAPSLIGGAGRSKADNIKAAVRAMLTHNETMHRTEILRGLVALELMGTEKDPISALAAYLSSWRDEFVSDGKGNFSLAPTKEEGSDDGESKPSISD